MPSGVGQMKAKSKRGFFLKLHRRMLRRRRGAEEGRQAVPGGEAAQAPGENPEVSARLTNLSLRHVGSRPAWFDYEPVSLPGRTRQCRKLFWQIESSNRACRSQLVVLHAPRGAGKTTFLAQLYAMLQQLPESVLMLAPGAPKPEPFHAVRNILEQRLYLSGDPAMPRVAEFVKAAVESIVPASEAGEVIGDLTALWRIGREKEENVVEGGGAESTVPPPLATRVTSMRAVMSPCGGSAELPREDPDGKKGTPETGDISDPGKNVVKNQSDREDNKEKVCNSETERDLAADGYFRAGNVETGVLAEPLADGSGLMACEGDARFASRLRRALSCFLGHDLRRNAIVIVMDNVGRYDSESIELLLKVFDDVGAARLTLLLTTDCPESLPVCVKERGDVQYTALKLLSDSDLMVLTRHAMKATSEHHDELVVPEEICRQIALHAYGSPKAAIEMVLKYFTPEYVIRYHETLELIRRQPLPRETGNAIVERYRACSQFEKFVLQAAAVLNAPFTVSTLESILSGIRAGDMAKVPDCTGVVRRLLDLGFFERFGSGAQGAGGALKFVFTRDCERIVIAASLGEKFRGAVCRHAAQWYELNNRDGAFDEAIGDFWRSSFAAEEACRFYEHAAYRAYNKALYVKSWPLFNKLTQSLPEGNMARKLVISLDSAEIAFRVGRIDEAFRLCRWTCYHARRMFAYGEAARANLQIASMLVELGSVRHVMRYVKRTRILLARESNGEVEMQLNGVLARLAFHRADYAGAWRYMEKVGALLKTTAHKVQDDLMAEFQLAQIDAQTDRPLSAVEAFGRILECAQKAGAKRICALTYRALGNTYQAMDNLAQALDSWNHALGLAQQMNDVILHAALLADIAEGAIALNACRTARAAIEQCLALAQQTRQRALIVRCLTSTARIQYLSGDPHKAMRTLKKAHRTACALQSVRLWTGALERILEIYADPKSEHYRPFVAEQLYTRLADVFERRHLPLQRARILSCHAQFLAMGGQKLPAQNACRAARSIYRDLGLEKLCEKIQKQLEQISRDKDAPEPSCPLQ